MNTKEVIRVMAKKGFTLIELVAVITILGIIALITTVSVLGLFNKSQTSLYDTQVEIIEAAAKKWIIANSGYLPVDGSSYTLELSRLVSDGYLDDGDVLDPRTKEAIDGYIEVYFDMSVNQYKSKLVNRAESVLTSASILAANTPVTSGSGLYSDITEAGRYYFKGTSVNNYLTFNNETWRIISIEADGRIKIIKQTGITGRAFDSAGARNVGNGNINCTNSNGCPIWASNEQGSVVNDSELLTYLNGDYYLSIDTTQKEVLSSGKWCYRHLSTGGDAASEFVVSQFDTFCENEFASHYIGLINIEEIREASLNECSYGTSASNACSSYLVNGEDYWTLNYDNDPLTITSGGKISYAYAKSTNIKTRPVLYINNSTQLTGTGTQTDPFLIKQTHS